MKIPSCELHEIQKSLLFDKAPTAAHQISIPPQYRKLINHTENEVNISFK